MRKIEDSIEKEFKKLPQEIKKILRDNWLSIEHAQRKELVFESEEDSQLYNGRQLIYTSLKQYLFNNILEQNEECVDNNGSEDIKESIKRCLKSLNNDYEEFKKSSQNKKLKYENPRKVFDDTMRYLVKVLKY